MMMIQIDEVDQSHISWWHVDDVGWWSWWYRLMRLVMYDVDDTGW